MWEAFAVQKFFLIFSTKNIGVFGYKIVKHLTSWTLNELLKGMMLWTTGPLCLIFAHEDYSIYIGPFSDVKIFDLLSIIVLVAWMSILLIWI